WVGDFTTRISRGRWIIHTCGFFAVGQTVIITIQSLPGRIGISQYLLGFIVFTRIQRIGGRIICSATGYFIAVGYSVSVTIHRLPGGTGIGRYLICYGITTAIQWIRAIGYFLAVGYTVPVAVCV